MAKRELPEWMEVELRDLAMSVRNSTLDSCIKILRLCKTTEEAERMVNKLKSTPPQPTA